MSLGFVLGGGAVSDRAVVTFPGCVEGDIATAGREALGNGGNMGSSTARGDGAADDDDGNWTFGGRALSETACGMGSAEAIITGGGGAAHPQSKGTSLLTRSILPS